MRELLEKWSKLEPHLCKRETRPNKNWHEEFEDYYIKDNQIGWQIVYFDGHNNLSDTIKKEAPAKIQWAIQQAIIEKGWYLEMYYTPSTYHEVIVINPSKAKDKAYSQNSMAEALLTAYLETLDA